MFDAWGFGSGSYPSERTRLPLPTSGPGESEFDGVFDTDGLFFATQSNETDSVVDTLGAVPVANVQRYGIPLCVEKQPIQTAVSNLVPEGE